MENIHPLGQLYSLKQLYDYSIVLEKALKCLSNKAIL